MKELRSVLFIQSFHSFTESILFILIPLLMVERKIDITTIGLVFAVSPFIFQLTRTAFAVISDIIGRKIFLVSHGALTSITSAIYYFAQKPIEFLYGNITNATRGAAFWSVNRAYVLDISKEPRKDLVRMLTIRNFVWGVGSLITGFLIVWLFYSGTLLLLFCIGPIGILVAFGVKSNNNNNNNRMVVKKALYHLDFRKKSKIFKKFLILFIIAGFSYGLIDGYVFPLFLKSSGFGVEAIGILIGIQSIITGIFAYMCTKKGHISKILLYGGLFYVLILPILGYANFALIPMVFLLFGIPVGITDGCTEGIFSKITNRKSYASDISLLLLGMHIGRSINQAVAGFLIKNFGFGVVFVISAALLLAYFIWASKILK